MCYIEDIATECYNDSQPLSGTIYTRAYRTCGMITIISGQLTVFGIVYYIMYIFNGGRHNKK